MSFLAVRPCCVSIPGELPGEPRGTMQPAENGRTIARYVVQPQKPVKDSKVAMVLFYDLMGFQTKNPKIIADEYADKLGVPVFVPDYIPNAPAPLLFSSVMPAFPEDPAHAQKSWYATIKDILYVFSKVWWQIPGFLPGRLNPLVTKAVQEVRAEGYERVGAIGYCRGGSMVIHLLSSGDSSLLNCGVVCHPAPDKSAYPKITKPNQWHFADHDTFFKDKDIADVRQGIEGRGVIFEQHIYDQTLHGFAARPNLEHPPSKKAFEEANAASVKFFQEHLKLSLDSA